MSMHLDFEPHSWYMGAAIKHNPEGYNDPCERDYVGGTKYRCYIHDEDVDILPHQFDDDSDVSCRGYTPKWSAYTDNGNTYRVDKLQADTLADLKQKIKRYHLERRNGYGERIAARRLEYLRTELQAERISYGELAELWKLHEYIEAGDVELLEAAGVPEGTK